MKELIARLGVAFAVIGAMTGGVWWAFNRGDATPSSPAQTDASAARDDDDASEQAPRARAAPTGVGAVNALQAIGEASQRLLPDGYTGIFIGMQLRDLRQVRRAIQRSNTRPERGELWEEDDAESGARVVYVLTESGLLSQVQFMSRLENLDQLAPHFTALQRRYGSPTGIWDCPETEQTPPMRRFTWRREGASLMEAVLIHGSTVSITLMVAPTDDIGAALQRSQCSPVQNAQQLASFPVARELRGERTTFIREVHRDGG